MFSEQLLDWLFCHCRLMSLHVNVVSAAGAGSQEHGS